MTTLTECAAPARPIPPDLEHVEGSPEILEDLTRHLEALRGMASHIAKPVLRRVMGIEIALTEGCLRGFVIVRAEPDPAGALASAERALCEVRLYADRLEYAEGLGYAQSALARVVESLGGPPMPPLVS